MSSDTSKTFTKENLDTYLKELAKEFRKKNGTAVPAEIILIGGAAILENYGFREMTTDVDAIIHAASSMKDAINKVGDKYGLPNGWLNTDFMMTSSYTPKLDEFSQYYRTFSNVLRIRTVSAEYLIAMKLKSGRKYKNDLSDIIGILQEHQNRQQPITMEMVETAVQNLYGGWADFSADSRPFIEKAISGENLQKAYALVREEEKNAKTILVDFEGDYPGVAKEDNVNDILRTLKAKKAKENS